MRFNYLCLRLLRQYSYKQIKLPVLHRYPIQWNIKFYSIKVTRYPLITTINTNSAYPKNREGDFVDVAGEYYEELYSQMPTRQILYPRVRDDLMKNLTTFTSAEDALDFISKNMDKMNCSHLTQAIIMFWDLRGLYHHLIHTGKTKQIANYDEDFDYNKVITKNQIFINLLNRLREKSEDFNTEQLSYVIYYLSKIGCDTKGDNFQKLVEQYNDKTVNKMFDLHELSRFMPGTFKFNDLSFFYVVKKYVPFVIDQINKCQTADDITVLTICLNTINSLISYKVLLSYRTKVYELMITKVLNGDEYKAVLKVITFLGFPQWRMENSRAISDCIMLLKGHLHKLNVDEIITIFETVRKIQQPGEILNELQRCASKYFIELEQNSSPFMEMRLKLLSCLMYYSSPLQRPNFVKIVRKYLDYKLSGTSTMELLQIILHSKLDDVSLNKTFWNKILDHLEDKNFRRGHLLKIANIYVNSEETVRLMKHPRCELKLAELLKRELDEGLSSFVPSKFSTIAAFMLTFSRSRSDLNRIIDGIEEFKYQFNCVDCLNVSQAVVYAGKFNRLLNRNDFVRLKYSLDDAALKLMKEVDNLGDTAFLLKACVVRGSMINNKFEKLWMVFDKTNGSINSKVLKNISYCMFSTSMLLPNLINGLADYIVKHKRNVMGFDVEKVLYVCFKLSQAPENSKAFFDVVADIILRDQERMTALSYIQACLSLSFFRALPISFIKRTYSMEFMNKIDNELKNCYFKENYTTRIRNTLMHLNRVTCLEYPESNVPWFHANYTEQNSDRKLITELQSSAILFYLKKLTKNVNCIRSDVLAPYGYRIDFVLHLNDADEFCEEINATKKIAILCVNPSAYTHCMKQLKGKKQLKVRHLEILGYKVAILNMLKWSSLFVHDEEVDYLKEILGMENVDDR